MMHKVLLGGVAVSILLSVTPARAADPPPPPRASSPPPRTVRIEYERGPGAQRCPGEQAFRDAVGAKVARDLFAAEPKPSVRLVVSLRRRGAGYEGTAELHDAAGAVTWSMLFPPPSHRPSSTCSNLILALAFGVSLDKVGFAPHSVLASPKAAEAFGAREPREDRTGRGRLPRVGMDSLGGIQATLVRTTTGGMGRRPTILLAPELTEERRHAMDIFELARWMLSLASCRKARETKAAA